MKRTLPTQMQYGGRDCWAGQAAVVVAKRQPFEIFNNTVLRE